MGRGDNTSQLDTQLPELIAKRGSTHRHAADLVREFAGTNMTAREIAARLNAAGIPTSRGLAWEPMHIYKLARTQGIPIKGRVAVAPEALTRLRDLYQQKLPLDQIVQLLNGEGFRTASGREWTVITLSNALQRAGVKRTRNERAFDEAVIKRVIELRVAGRSLDQIARILTDEGYHTPLDGRWWPATVKTVIEIARRRSDLSEKERAALEQRRTRGTWPKGNPRAKVARETVELILELRAERDEAGAPLTFQTIAEKLDALGIPTARAAEGWRASTVRAIWATAAERLGA